MQNKQKPELPELLEPVLPRGFVGLPVVIQIDEIDIVHDAFEIPVYPSNTTTRNQGPVPFGRWF